MLRSPLPPPYTPAWAGAGLQWVCPVMEAQMLELLPSLLSALNKPWGTPETRALGRMACQGQPRRLIPLQEQERPDLRA